MFEGLDRLFFPAHPSLTFVCALNECCTMFLRSRYVMSTLYFSYIKRLPFKSVQEILGKRRICLQFRVDAKL